MRQLKISTDKLTRRTDTIQRYFSEVERNHPMLSSDEEFKIGTLAQQGDEAAIRKLISSNLRFVVSVAKQYSNQYVPLDELISQGNIGLCDAARTFDPTRGFKFISYAVWHIRKEILFYLNNDQRIIRLPQNVISDIAKLRRAEESLLQEEERTGSIEELAERVEKSGKEILSKQLDRLAAGEITGVPLESDNPDEDFAPINWLSNGSNTSEFTDIEDIKITADLALSRLTSLQREVVVSRLGIGLHEPETFSTIAQKFGRTPEWARTVYLKSLKLMRAKLNRASLGHDKVLNHEI